MRENGEDEARSATLYKSHEPTDSRIFVSGGRGVPTTHGCRATSSMLSRAVGSFCSNPPISSRNGSEIPSSGKWTLASLMALCSWKTDPESARNGTSPWTSAYSVTPRLHRSMAAPEIFRGKLDRHSGGVKAGVPEQQELSCAEPPSESVMRSHDPRSPIFTVPFLATSMFSGFKSRWAMPWRWRQSTPARMSRKWARASASSKGLSIIRPTTAAVVNESMNTPVLKWRQDGCGKMCVGGRGRKSGNRRWGTLTTGNRHELAVAVLEYHVEVVIVGLVHDVSQFYSAPQRRTFCIVSGDENLNTWEVFRRAKKFFIFQREFLRNEKFDQILRHDKSFSWEKSSKKNWFFQCMKWKDMGNFLKFNKFLCRLIDWLVNWLVDWLIDWLICRLIDWFVDWLVDWLIYWLIWRLIGGLIDLLIYWLIGGLIDWLIQ